MTNTQNRIAAIYAAADHAGFPLEVKQGLWQQLAQVDTPAGRDMILTRWEQSAGDWPSAPVSEVERNEWASVEFVV
jgi:hypothetical protein